ncbi:MAG: hypothetical protein ISS72_03675 [Candidatus Brocadiae bacterium]|nr:hypothetical protein [Candidatus Brocadiia bacterium]
MTRHVWAMGLAALLAGCAGVAKRNVDPTILQMRLVANEAGPDTEAMTLRTARGEEAIHVQKAVLLNAADVRRAWVDAKSAAPGTHSIGLAFNKQGAEKFEAVTTANIGRRLAIVVDGKVLSAPVIRSAIRDRAQIAGAFTLEEARAMARKISAAAGG